MGEKVLIVDFLQQKKVKDFSTFFFFHDDSRHVINVYAIRSSQLLRSVSFVSKMLNDTNLSDESHAQRRRQLGLGWREGLLLTSIPNKT